MSLADKDRRLIPEYEGESYYWRKENDIKESIEELNDKIDHVCSDKCLRIDNDEQKALVLSAKMCIKSDIRKIFGDALCVNSATEEKI